MNNDKLTRCSTQTRNHELAAPRHMSRAGQRGVRLMTNEAQLLEQIVEGLTLAFDECRVAAGANNIIGYAIRSDDAGISFTPVAATSTGLASFTAGEKSDYRFNPDNWEVQRGVGYLASVHTAIEALYEECEDEENDANWHEEYRSRVYQIAVRALEKLVSSGYFESGVAHDQLFLTCWISDSKANNMKTRAWSKRLNSPEVHSAFINWMDQKFGA